ncbi:AAA family ATPase [Amycolatopsis sp. NPDC004772]
MTQASFDRGAIVMGELAVENEDRDDGRNEATTRLQIIDRIFFDALGWRRDDCILEDPLDGTYTDYSLGKPATRLIVEAKKEGVYFSIPSAGGPQIVRLPNLLKGNPNLTAAVKQAASYCSSRGVGLAAVTNGNQLVAFIGSRVDGTAPTSGRAVVFRSLREMEEKFIDLWNWLSPEGVNHGTLEELLTSESRPLPPEKLSQRLFRYPGLKSRNEIEIELDILGELFLQDIVKAKELEDDFLRECYCSSGALSQYALVSKEILRNRYSEISAAQGSKTTSVTSKDGISRELFEAVIAKGVSRRPVVLLGDVGVGKTTFIRHLVRIDAKEELEKSIVLYVDFGSQPALRRDLETFVTENFAKQLLDNYDVDLYSNDFVRAVYNGELNRLARGIYGPLKEADPSKYLEKELSLLADLTGKLESHLKASFEHLRASQKRSAVVFFDNIDQRDSEFQDAVYLIAQSLSESWNLTTFISLRPDTFNHSRKTGSLAAYQPRVFTISPPRIDQVVIRRLKFAQQVINAGRFSLGAEGITLDSSLLRDYIDVLIRSLSTNTQLSECLDNVSQGNVRQALNLLTSFVGSGHVDTRKILDIYRKTGRYIIPLHEFLRAILYGDTEHFDPTASPIANAFDISSRSPREHFSLLVILNFLERQAHHASAELGFILSEAIYDNCQSLGIRGDEVDAALARGADAGLIDVSIDEGTTGTGASERFRITQNGAYLLHRLTHLFVYYDAVVVDTPILSDEVRPKLGEARTIEDRLDRAEDFLTYLDEQYENFGELDTGLDWDLISTEARKDISRIWDALERSEARKAWDKLRSQWTTRREPEI